MTDLIHLELELNDIIDPSKIEELRDEASDMVDDLNTDIDDLNEEKDDIELEDEEDQDKERIREIESIIDTKQKLVEEWKNDHKILDEIYSNLNGTSESLIHENYFNEYTKDSVQECYDMSALPNFITNHIDWDAVANECRVDYMDIEILGTAYFYRS